jgi:phytoene synthase
MEALYRFCWAADEISDSSEPLALKKRNLARFKKNLSLCLAGKPQGLLFQKLGETTSRFHLSPEPLERILAGVERDLRPLAFKRFAELHRYALQVAGGPGLASMEIFGFRDPAHRAYAENLGVFLQIVNIVRDFREDLGLGRRYLPSEDFKRFHLNPSSIGENNSHWKPFVEFQLDRAWSFLEKARRSLTPKQRSELPTAEAIGAVYVKLHQRLRNHPALILQGRVHLSSRDKLLSVAGITGRCLWWRLANA